MTDAPMTRTPRGIVVYARLWWSASGPSRDPYATDSAALHASRARVLARTDLVVPGHGAPFEPDVRTPR